MTRMKTDMQMHSTLARRRARQAAWGLLACGAAVPMLMFCGCKKEQAPEALVSVQAVHPEVGAITEHIQADAILAPVAQAAIVPKITAPVAKFYVQRGSRVRAGELLAVLENKDIAAAALDSRGVYQAAQGAYATATRAQIPEDAQAAQAAADQARANLKLNEDIVKSRTALLAQGAIPQRDLDSAKAALVQAQGAYAIALKHLNSVRQVNGKAALQQAQGQLMSAEGKYEGAEAQVNYSEIRSPIDGVITDRPLFAGETASTGTPLLTVMETSTLVAKAHIGQSQAQQLKVGDAAQVLVPGMAAPAPAKVTLVSPALDPGSTTVEIWLGIDNRSGALKVGTPVKVSIAGRSEAHAVKIPLAAVLTAQDGSRSVMVVGADGVARRRPVTLGLVDVDEAQVLSGVTPADTVITTGAYGLDDGTKVKVGAADDKKSAGGDA